MTIAVNDLVDDIEELSGDSDNDRTSAAQIIKYINLAQRDIVIRTRNLGLRPAYTRTLNIQLQAGATQNIDSCKYYDGSFKTIDDCYDLLEIHRNMGKTWVTGTDYYIGDTVFANTSYTRYECLEAHTGGTFATDLAANKWVASTDLSGPHIEQIHPTNLEYYIPNWAHVDDPTNSEIYYWSPD